MSDEPDATQDLCTPHSWSWDADWNEWWCVICGWEESAAEHEHSAVSP